MIEIANRMELEQRLRAYCSGEQPRTELEKWFTQILVGEHVEVLAEDYEVIFHVLYMFDDPPVPAAGLPGMARDVLWVITSVPTWAQQRDLLELISMRDRFTELLQKRLSNRMSATAWSNALMHTRFSRALKRRLEQMPPDRLRALAAGLDNNSLEAVVDVLL